MESERFLVTGTWAVRNPVRENVPMVIFDLQFADDVARAFIRAARPSRVPNRSPWGQKFQRNRQHMLLSGFVYD